MTALGASLSTFENIVQVVCPKCGHHGTATWDAAVSGRASGRRELIDLSAGFVAIDASAKISPRILCAACRVPAEDRRA